MKVQIKSSGATVTRSARPATTAKRIVIRNHRGSARPVRNVTLNLRNAPVRTALLQLFQKAHRDYALDSSIDGVVSMRVTNVPFDRALRLLANSSSTPLTYSIDSGVYFLKARTTQAVRNNTPIVAQNDTVQQATEAEQVEQATTPVTPQVNFLGNTFTNGGIVPASSLPSFGYSPLNYPANYILPNASQSGFYGFGAGSPFGSPFGFNYYGNTGYVNPPAVNNGGQTTIQTGGATVTTNGNVINLP